MKEIYLMTITFLLLLSATLFPNQAGAVVCQNKTVIVYSNGMFNDVKDANISLALLKNEWVADKVLTFNFKGFTDHAEII